MAGVTVRIERKGGLLDKLTRQVPANAAAITREAAEEAAGYVQKHWSGYYPPASGPGEPPAIRTGMLDASVEVEPQQKGVKTVMLLKAQAPYAAALEYGTKKMAARPYLRPALAWLEKQYRTRFKKVFQVS